MKVFVTGGTGLLGNAILRQLKTAGHESVALVRSAYEPIVFEGVETEFVTGDLLDREVMFRAVEDCDVVIHAAGMIHLGWKKLQESMRVNAEGTQVLVDACSRYGRKLVHVGTVNALAVGTRMQPANETTLLDNAGGQVPCSYVVSKRAGVDAVKKGVSQGLQAVILAPGFMLGPWDWKPSSGRMMMALSKGWKAIAPSGGCGVCDVRDVAEATVHAAQTTLPSGRVRPCRGKYDLLATVGRHGQEIRQTCSDHACWSIAKMDCSSGGRLHGQIRDEPDFNSAAMRMSAQYHWYDSSQAHE